MLLHHFRVWRATPACNIGTITFLINIFVTSPTSKIQSKIILSLCFYYALNSNYSQVINTNTHNKKTATKNKYF